MQDTAATTRHQVTVTLGITDDQGTTQTVEKTIDAGATSVTVLKAELGVPEDSSLWVIGRDGRKRVLADHETYDVHEGDHFEALVKGGIS
jgi:hypothetical protein